jgi:hypothetical protein
MSSTVKPDINQFDECKPLAKEEKPVLFKR